MLYVAGKTMPETNKITIFHILIISIIVSKLKRQVLAAGSVQPTNLTTFNPPASISSRLTAGNESIEGRSFYNPCASHPCRNGGTCSWTGSRIMCACPGRYSGIYCEVLSHPRTNDVCSTSSCQNGGRCQPYNGPPYTCICTDSFYGPTCGEKRITSMCFPNPCFNGGRCHVSPYEGFLCSCSTLYTGPRCEVLVAKRSCQDISCLNGGTCTPAVNGFVCYCTPGFAGRLCGIRKVDLCTPNPCYNGGLCLEAPYGATGNLYRCVCPQGYTGTRCEKQNPGVTTQESRNGACASNPCKGDCRCYDSCRHSSGYYCRSPSGFLGKDCSIPPPVLRCDPNLVTVVVDDSFVQEYDWGTANVKVVMAQTANSVIRASKECLAKYDGNQYTFAIHLPFANCETRTTRSADGSAVFANNVWLNRIIGGGFDMPVPVVSFECAYQKNYSIVTKLQPSHSQPLLIRQSGKIVLEGSIDLCKVQSACHRACPPQFSVTEGAVYTVGEMIHLNIHKAKNDLKTIVALRDLFITCSRPSTDKVIPLVQNGCAVGSIPSVITHSGVSSSICASFQVPRLENCNNFYIHAKMESCPVTGCITPSPQYGCTAGGRKKRYVDDGKVKIVIGNVKGPIYVLQGSEGIPNEILFPDRERVDFDGQIIDHLEIDYAKGTALDEESNEEADTTMLFIVVGSFCVVVAVLVFLGTHYFVKYKKDRLN